jgi:hypothetical protein
MRKGGKTFFHRRAALWTEAKNAIEAFEAASGLTFTAEERPDQFGDSWDEATRKIQKFEAFCDYMDQFYHMLSEAMRVADEAVKAAGLDNRSPEGEKLYNQTRKEYEEEHWITFPE